MALDAGFALFGIGSASISYLVTALPGHRPTEPLLLSMGWEPSGSGRGKPTAADDFSLTISRCAEHAGVARGRHLIGLQTVEGGRSWIDAVVAPCGADIWRHNEGHLRQERIRNAHVR